MSDSSAAMTMTLDATPVDDDTAYEPSPPVDSVPDVAAENTAAWNDYLTKVETDIAYAHVDGYEMNGIAGTENLGPLPEALRDRVTRILAAQDLSRERIRARQADVTDQLNAIARVPAEPKPTTGVYLDQLG